MPEGSVVRRQSPAPWSSAESCRPVLRWCSEVDFGGEPAAWGVGGGNGAAHRLDEAAGDRQAEAHADAGVMVSEPLERREQLVLGAARYTRSLVDDGDQHAVADLTRRDAHRAVGRVSQRVVDEVGQHAFEQTAVGHHNCVVHLNLDTVEALSTEPGDALTDSEQSALHGFLEVYPPQLRTQHTGGQPRRVEQVADERGERID